ncbi:glycosyltransferase family 2 protein [Rubripirellula sp.]|jgi:glycosyltransferase involved in cell wall biosynthesis|nr:glycosyltransferase family 2 protein [Rubripirellula sp.]MDB4749773.1 glycosyltransferase family 2 protein [Rubripirellula sp.]
MQTKLSVSIICLNEAGIIGDCLQQAARVADEIVIVDSGSTDKTLEIAESHGAKIFHQDWLGYGKQKNFALAQCSNEWVLSLDADEVLTDELIEEIESLDLEADVVGYRVARKLFVGDQYICWGGYYPDYQLRLFRNSLGGFNDLAVHESVQLPQNSKVRNLKSPLDHFSYESLEQMDAAFKKFAKLSTKKRNWLLNPFRAVFNFFYTFFYKYFLRLGFLHGATGVRLAWIHSKYSFLKYIYRM